MRLQDVMSPHVETVSPEESLVIANERMWRRRIHHLVVVDAQGGVLGVLSDADLGGDDADELADGQQVREVMKASPVVAHVHTTVTDARHLMQGHRIRCLPVVDDAKHLVGIVTETDLSRLVKRDKVLPETASHEDPGTYVRQDQRDRRGAHSKFGHMGRPSSS